MIKQKMDADWLEFHTDPKVPDFKLPAGAVDAHCHVFGPSPNFPFALERNIHRVMRAKINCMRCVTTLDLPAT